MFFLCTVSSPVPAVCSIPILSFTQPSGYQNSQTIPVPLYPHISTAHCGPRYEIMRSHIRRRFPDHRLDPTGENITTSRNFQLNACFMELSPQRKKTQYRSHLDSNTKTKVCAAPGTMLSILQTSAQVPQTLMRPILLPPPPFCQQGI